MLKSVNIFNFIFKLIFFFTVIHQELAAVRADGKKIGSIKINQLLSSLFVLEKYTSLKVLLFFFFKSFIGFH